MRANAALLARSERALAVIRPAASFPPAAPRQAGQ